MAFIVEDGSVVTGANAYVTEAEGDDYFALHLYGTQWTDATSAKKKSAIVMSTRMVDSSFTYKGNQFTTTQSLKWPRYGVQIPSDPSAGYAYSSNRENLSPDYFYTLPSDVIPQALKNAVLEMCRFLLAKDRSSEMDDLGNIKREKVGPLETEYFDMAKVDIIPDDVSRMLSELVLSKPNKNLGSSGYSFASRG